MVTFKTARGFTLLELLVVVAIIGVLAALLFPGLSRAKGKAQQAVCLSNLRQINASVRLYADDFNDALPPPTDGPQGAFTDYARLTKAYAGLTGQASERAKLFACPADTFYYDMPTTARAYRVPQSLHDLAPAYSSYAFNGGNFPYGVSWEPRWPGIAGRKLASVKNSSRTVLVLEFVGLIPYSWHQPAAAPGHHNNARSVVSFADGHASYIPMHWDSENASGAHLEAWQYDPPPEYAYQWSPD